ncbi:MAG: hypothetical protein NTV34_15275 [Proteobacteria bacterium]|nr:hypothetical protein [Pseudomonadota bacterium]
MQKTEKMSEQGSSTLEFIFCAPLLMILMFVVLEIHERIEQRVTSAIAAGNASWLTDPNQMTAAGGPEAENLTKADVLGAHSNPNNGIVAVNNNAVRSDSSVVMSYTDTKRRADAYNLQIESRSDATATNTARERALTTIGTSSADSVSTNLVLATDSVSRAFKSFTNSRVSWIPRLFPANEIEEHRLSWSVSETGTTNAAIQAIGDLATTIDHNLASDLQSSEDPSHRLLAQHSTYLRRDPAYHPEGTSSNGYRNEALFGAIVGTGNFDAFIDDCFMKLVVDASTCGRKNSFVDYVKKIYRNVAIGKTMIDIAGLTCAATTIVGAAMCLLNSVIIKGTEKTLTDVVTNKIEGLKKVVINAVDDKITSVINSAAGSLGTQLEAQIQIAIDQVKQQVTNAATSTIPGEATSAP